MPEARLPFAEIVRRLNDDPELVTGRYCSPEGAWRDHQGRLFCLSPLRPDRHAGSFYINLRGAHAGHWRDEATGDHGDMLDLIEGAGNCDRITAIGIAKSLLGLDDTSPACKRAMDAQARARRRAREAEASRAGEAAAKRERWAQRLWLSGQERIANTPVDHYLQGRGIELCKLGRQPRALRYHPSCLYQGHDPATGEVIEERLPAMLAAITSRGGRFIGCHRTWLAPMPTGRVVKAPVDQPRKVLGAKKGGSIRIWSGAGPRGGKGCPLSRAPDGARVYIAEGIEDALSVAMLAPHVRVLAAIDLGNMAAIALPPAVSEVVLVADNDPGAQARAALDRAVETHARAGRGVRVWRNEWGGKDVNDALTGALEGTLETGGAGHAA